MSLCLLYFVHFELLADNSSLHHYITSKLVRIYIALLSVCTMRLHIDAIVVRANNDLTFVHTRAYTSCAPYTCRLRNFWKQFFSFLTSLLARAEFMKRLKCKKREKIIIAKVIGNECVSDFNVTYLHVSHVESNRMSMYN